MAVAAEQVVAAVKVLEASCRDVIGYAKLAGKKIDFTPPVVSTASRHHKTEVLTSVLMVPMSQLTLVRLSAQP